MAVRRPGEKLCAGGRTGEQRCRRGSEEEEEREKVRRTDLKFSESSRPLGKLKIPTDIEIK
jgi:hypothetical protein